MTVFDALRRFRTGQPRGCAFLAAATELSGHDNPALAVVAADTEHLRHQLRTLADDLDVDVADPHELAEQVLLAYDGTLSAFLSGSHGDPIARGRHLAHITITAALCQH